MAMIMSISALALGLAIVILAIIRKLRPQIAAVSKEEESEVNRNV